MKGPNGGEVWVADSIKDCYRIAKLNKWRLTAKPKYLGLGYMLGTEGLRNYEVEYEKIPTTEIIAEEL